MDQQPCDQQVDASRQTPTERVNFPEQVGIERGLAAPSQAAETVLQVGPHLVGIEWPEMRAGDDALSALLERRTRQHVAKLRLAEKKDLGHRPILLTKVGQHTQRLQSLESEALGLVDDQQHSLSLAVSPPEVTLDQAEQAGGGRVRGVELERARHELQHFLRSQACRVDARDKQALVAELLLEVGDQGRLARTDLAGDDYEALALLQAEGKGGHGPPVRPPGVEKPWRLFSGSRVLGSGLR